LGTLTGIAIRLRKQYNTQLEIANPTPKVSETLKTIGLNKIFKLSGEKDFSAFPTTTTLSFSSQDKRELTRHMLEAHDNLIKVNQENQKRFQQVKEALKKELEK